MILTEENYYSPEADIEYCSASQFKSFFWTQGMEGCEAKTMAKIKGYWKEEPSTAMILGSYIDAHFEGTLDVFKAKHPEIYTKKGELLAAFKDAEKMIGRCEKDEYFMKFMSGLKQKIFTANIFGINWKCKLDSYLPGIAIVDLKSTRSIVDKSWNIDYTKKISFVEAYGYDIQLALYQKIVAQNYKVNLPCYIAAVSKESEPDIEIIAFEQETLDLAMGHVESMASRLIDLKSGKEQPKRCEKCDYCRASKKLTKPKLLRYL